MLYFPDVALRENFPPPAALRSILHAVKHALAILDRGSHRKGDWPGTAGQEKGGAPTLSAVPAVPAVPAAAAASALFSGGEKTLCETSVCTRFIKLKLSQDLTTRAKKVLGM